MIGLLFLCVKKHYTGNINYLNEVRFFNFNIQPWGGNPQALLVKIKKK